MLWNKILGWIQNPVLPDWACWALIGSKDCRVCWLCALMIVLVIAFVLVALS